MKCSRLRRATAAVALCAALGACGADTTTSTASPLPAPSEMPESTGQLTTSQAYDLADNSITSLDQIVTGDRAIMLWYWAPH